MLKVAVLDGNAISRNLLTSVLAGGGYDVVTETNTGSAAMATVIRLQPQIVCIDIGQPDEDGLARLDALHAALPKALLFLVSSQLDAATVQSALQHHAHGFIVKPFNGQKVLAAIRNTVIQLARQHRGARQASE